MALPTEQQVNQSMTVGAYQPPLTLSPDIATKSPLEKAAYYNTLLGQGYSDAQIRQAAGTQTDTDWSALQGLASGLQPKTPAPPSASSVNALSAAPAASSSFNGMVLNNLYQQMLGRAPDESGFNFWLNRRWLPRNSCVRRSINLDLPLPLLQPILLLQLRPQAKRLLQVGRFPLLGMRQRVPLIRLLAQVPLLIKTL
jgi:hypothetical protein